MMHKPPMWTTHQIAFKHQSTSQVRVQFHGTQTRVIVRQV